MRRLRVVRGIANRWFILRRYAAAAPSALALPQWLFLGALRSRLLGGSGRFATRSNGKARDLRIRIGQKSGEYVIVDTSSFSELDVLQEVLVDRIYPLDRINFSPTMILDCGANIGFFSSLCRLYFPKAEIICWEPDSRNFARLVKQPMLQSEFVRCIKSAVSNADGEATLIGSGTGCTVSRSVAGADLRVGTIDLRRWIELNCKPPFLIKMDIEGHEVEVVDALVGAWKGPCALFLETHAENGRDERILSQLRSAGFDLTQLRSHNLPGDHRVFKEYLGELGMKAV